MIARVGFIGNLKNALACVAKIRGIADWRSVPILSRRGASLSTRAADANANQEKGQKDEGRPERPVQPRKGHRASTFTSWRQGPSTVAVSEETHLSKGAARARRGQAQVSQAAGHFSIGETHFSRAAGRRCLGRTHSSKPAGHFSIGQTRSSTP